MSRGGQANGRMTETQLSIQLNPFAIRSLFKLPILTGPCYRCAWLLRDIPLVKRRLTSALACPLTCGMAAALELIGKSLGQRTEVAITQRQPVWKS